jgi:hypothetical protein
MRIKSLSTIVPSIILNGVNPSLVPFIDPIHNCGFFELTFILQNISLFVPTVCPVEVVASGTKVRYRVPVVIAVVFIVDAEPVNEPLKAVAVKVPVEGT